MTFQNKLIEMLMKNGMSNQQSNEVLKFAKPQIDEMLDGYSINLNSDANSYPPIIVSLLYSLIKPIALEWIEKNIPKAWFKPMFE